MIDIFIEVKTVSEANISGHWDRYRRQQQQKKAVYWKFFSTLKKEELIDIKSNKNKLQILMIRRGKRLMDSDNLSSSLKAIRDSIADFIYPNQKPGLADSDQKTDWHYGQLVTKGKVGVWIIIFT